jgi:hypothetical protein
MNKELDTMLKMGVYSVVDCPEDRKQVGCRWVLEFKVEGDADPLYKARLVTKGSPRSLMLISVPHLLLSPGCPPYALSLP